MVSLFKRKKLIGYILEKKDSGGWIAVTNYSAEDWPQAPSWDEISDDIDEESTYRLSSVYSDNSKVVLRTRPKIKRKAAASGLSEIQKAAEQMAQVASAFAMYREAVKRIAFEGFGGGEV